MSGTKCMYSYGFFLISPFSETIAKRATSIPRDNLISLGVCFGKFTKTGKFTLHVTALDFIAQYSKYKIWLKNTSEMSYVYGNNILKAHIAKMTEDIPEYQGVVVMSSNDIPLVRRTERKSSLYLLLFFRDLLWLQRVLLVVLN